MLKFDRVSLSYGTQKILNNISFEIPDGQFAVFIGPSGCGKTTTLKMINRLIQPDSGHIYLNGQDIAASDRYQLRRHTGYVIQQIGLFPNMTVEQNISVVPKLLNWPKEKCSQVVHDLLDIVDMPYEQYAHKYPGQMSGGQQQRIGVLRALAASPPIVLMDEPFGALDPMTRANLQQEVKSLQQKLHKTIVFVTHDMDEALDLADRIIFMDQGKVVQIAPPEELLAKPANDLVRSFMGKRLASTSPVALTAADFMKSRVYSANKERTLEECIQRMARHHVDTLVITEKDGRFVGVVSIDAIRKSGLPRQSTVEQLAVKEVPVSELSEDAKLCLDKFTSTDSRYIVVLDEGRVAGIVTKTSMAEALADALWGEES